MKVTFADFGPEIASSRLRAAIPQREMEKLGICRGRDVLVYGKHVLGFDQIAGFGKKVFDICDDHFRHPELRGYYLEHAERADLLTCNSEVMQRRIREETGRDASVILEPYESPERPAEIGPTLLWYGHASNLQDLRRIRPQLNYPLHALTNHPEYAQWTPQAFSTAIARPCIVVIPTGKSPAKSENRMVEAIRCGRYVCAEHLPAYEPFSGFFPIGDIPAHIEAALDDPEQSLGRIRAAQEYIRSKYSPEAIGKQWLGVIREHIQLRRTTDSRRELAAP